MTMRSKPAGHAARCGLHPGALARGLLDSSPENRRQEESNNLEGSGGEEIEDLLNGLVGAVVGGFKFAGGLVRRVGAVMKAAVGEGATESLMEEEEEQRDPFRCETVGVAGSVTLEQAV